MRQARAVNRLTAVKRPATGVIAIADSSHGIGGVCRVVTTGMLSISAMATGRWWRLWLWTMSKRRAPVRARSSISPR